MLIIENGKEIYKFKANNGNVNITSQFRLGSISNEFDSSDLKEVYFRGNVFDISVNYNFINKSEILNIHKYLMIKTSI